MQWGVISLRFSVLRSLNRENNGFHAKIYFCITWKKITVKIFKSLINLIKRLSQLLFCEFFCFSCFRSHLGTGCWRCYSVLEIPIMVKLVPSYHGRFLMIDDHQARTFQNRQFEFGLLQPHRCRCAYFSSRTSKYYRLKRI